MRALRSPAIRERASPESVPRKLSLSPRTPTSAATPTATDRTTKPNLPGADFKSRQAMAPARFQPNARLAMFLLALEECFDVLRSIERQCIFHDHAVFEHNLSVRPARYFGVVCN